MVFHIFFLNTIVLGNNWGPNSYGGGGGGPMRSNYSSNRSTPYGNPGSCIYFVISTYYKLKNFF